MAAPSVSALETTESYASDEWILRCVNFLNGAVSQRERQMSKGKEKRKRKLLLSRSPGRPATENRNM